MTYHITQIDNQSGKSVALVNPASNPGGRDSRITLSGASYSPQAPIEINFIRNTGTVSYENAAPIAINIYTTKDNWFFWDNGNSSLNGVAESVPGQGINFYNGPAGNLKMTIDPTGGVSFTAA